MSYHDVIDMLTMVQKSIRRQQSATDNLRAQEERNGE